MKKSLRLMVGAIALVIIATGLAGTSQASASTPVITAGSKGAIGGGGASFPNDQYQKWITDITALSPSVGFGTDSTSKLVLTYTKSSSGTGKSNFKGANARTASNMFNGTDSLLSSADTTATNTKLGDRTKWTQIPMTAGPIAVITNLPGVSANIKLDASVLCEIYAGTIKVWNDAKILALNPTVKALKTMSNTIVPVARDATSGTTFIFVSYLATGAGNTTHRCSYTSDWTNSVTSFGSLSGTLSPADAIMATRFSAMRTANGAGAIQGKTGNDGVRDYVNATSYSIGYVEMAYSYASSIRQAALATADTAALAIASRKFVLPSQAGANAAIAAQNTGTNTGVTGTGSMVNPDSTYIQPVNMAGANTYPVVGFSWVLLYLEFDSTITNAPTLGQVEGLIYFLNWSLAKGGVFTSGTTKCYSPLPANVKALVVAELKKVKYSSNGTTFTTVWR